MTLHGDVRANGHLVGSWCATRITNTADAATEPDTESVYTWSYQDAATRRITDGEIVHRYGDGATVLASKVLLALAPTPGVPQ